MQIANKKDIPEELIVEIEKLSNLGYGIARVDGYVIFVENACPGDKVKIRVGKKNRFSCKKPLQHYHKRRFRKIDGSKKSKNCPSI